MKKASLFLSFFIALFLFSACTDDTEQCLYSPKVFD
ncbi:putative lipoprotein, partial [Bacteroides fragilis str. 3988 T1]